MLSRRSALLMPVLLLAFGGGAMGQSPDADEPVRRLYAGYGVGDVPDLGRLGRRDPATLYSRSLLALYRRAAKAGLDSDFFVQGQDFSLARPIDIDRVVVTGDKASVAVTLTSNIVDPKTHRKQVDAFVFSTVKEGGRWRIDEARHGRDSLRRAWLAAIRNPA